MVSLPEMGNTSVRGDVRRKGEAGEVSGEMRDVCKTVEIPGVVKRWLRMIEAWHRPEGVGDWYMMMVFWVPELRGETWDGKRGVDELRVVWRAKNEGEL